jgi:hypothetical protein
LSINPQVGFIALQELTGESIGALGESPIVSGAPTQPTTPEKKTPASGPPSTQTDQPRTPRGAEAQLLDGTAFTILQAQSQHILKFTALGERELKHPLLCTPKMFSCPFTHELERAPMLAHPGTAGSYECRLSPTGDLVIGRRIFESVSDYVTAGARRTNGVHAG